MIKLFSGRKSRSSSRGSTEAPKPKRPLSIASIIGTLLAVGIFGGAVMNYGYVYDDTARATAWLACSLFAAWGLVMLARGAWLPRDTRPALWVIALLGLYALWGGLQTVRLPSSFVLSISPIWRTIKESFDAAGIPFPERVALATAPDKAVFSLNQMIAGLCFFIGATALASRRMGAVSLILIVTFFSIFEGIVGVARFAFTSAGRTSGIVYNPNHHAAAVIMGLPLALVCLTYLRSTAWGRRRTQEHSRQDQLVLLSAVLAIAAIGWLVSLSRGSLLAGLFILTAWWAWEAWMNFKEFQRYQKISFWDWFRGLPLLPILVPVISLFLLLTFAAFLPAILKRLENPDMHFMGRAQLWHASLRGMLDSNMLGLGFGGAEFAMNQYMVSRPTRYAPVWSHNDYVQTVTELGLVGLVVGVVCLGGCALSLYRQERRLARELRWAQRLPRRAMLVGVLITLMHAIGEFHLRIPIVGLQFLSLLALLLNASGIEPLVDRSQRVKIKLLKKRS